MNWGHKNQFLNNYKNMFQTKKLYIYGAGKIGEYVYESLCVKEIKVFDRNYKNLNNKDFKVYDPKEIASLDKSNSILIIAIQRYSAVPIIEFFLNRGWQFGYNLFYGEDFVDIYITPYKYVHDELLYIKNLTVSVSKKCTMKCKECSQRMTYQKEQNLESLIELKKRIDMLFRKIDYVHSMAITGGEPFLFKQLNEFLTYLMSNYSKKIGNIRVVSNGTMIPNDQFFKVANKYRISLEITEYNYSFSKIDLIKKLCETNMINFVANKHEHWFKMWNLSKKSKEEADWIFDNCICNNHCEGFIDGRLTRCLCAYFAKNTYEEFDMLEDSLLLNEDTSKEDIFVYLMGFVKEGHLYACEYCDGLYNVNSNYVIPAEQI